MTMGAVSALGITVITIAAANTGARERKGSTLSGEADQPGDEGEGDRTR